MSTTPPITIERFTELAHRTASRYSHRSEPSKIAYTFLPHTLEHFHHLVCADIDKHPTATPEQIDAHLDAVLRAAGSGLRHYTMQKSLDDMRAAMRKAITGDLTC